ncbi:MAG: DUF262 domain-containing protein [Bacteroidota bacterium]
MATNKLELYSLYQLHDNNILKQDQNIQKEVHYFIDSYQRGYRWDKHQIELLLQDFWEFHQKAIKKQLQANEYYCLQPIVVKPKTIDGIFYWEVLDGQQRLTSLKILIQYLLAETKTTLAEEYNLNDFMISYKTRVQSSSFLNEIGITYNNSSRTDNIDYFYMSNAFEAITNWFKEKGIDQKRDKRTFLDQLMSDKDQGNPVKVIWYEVNDETDSYEIFTRLNIGKIKLTNSELIKALFLRRPNSGDLHEDIKLRDLSHDWNVLEQKLQNDELWYFLYKKNKHNVYTNRIEYIFDLYCDKDENSEEGHSFYKMHEKIGDDIEVSITSRINEWKNFKAYFQKIEGWFIDYQFYHYIGYLVAVGHPLKHIIKESDQLDKLAFLNHLKKELVAKFVPSSRTDLMDLKYGNKLVFNTLLLFNIETVLSNINSNYRFPFNLFKTQNWDIEHIRSQNDKVLITDEEWRAWALDIVEYFTGANITVVFENHPLFDVIVIEELFHLKDFEESLAGSLTNIITSFVANTCNKTSMSPYFQYFKSYFKEDNDEITKDSIYNLALLDSYTNRSYKNAFYPLKRKRIQDNGKYGIFAPVCTTNTFMKVYSKKLDNLTFWSESDAESYLSEMVKVLKPYLND